MTDVTQSVTTQPAGTNWAGNLAYSADAVASPETVAEVQELVRAAASAPARVRALGSRH